MRYLSHFITIILVTHTAILIFFGLMWYFSDLDQALNNVSGYHITQDNGIVHFHHFNLLHYMFLTYIPAMVIAPIGCFVDWLNRPKKIHQTALGKPLPDIKL